MIYLCGITSNEFDNIKALTAPVLEPLDGLIFVVDDKAEEDGTRQYLEDNCGYGKVLHRSWSNDHDLQMNEFLRNGGMEDGDWFILRDSMERFSEKFANELPNMIEQFEKLGVQSVYNYGKGFAFKWNDAMVFQSSPHWGLQGARGEAIDIKDQHDEDKQEWTWRLRDGESGGRPLDNKIDHEAKYYWTYGRSNHLLLGKDNYEEFLQEDARRLALRVYAKEKGYGTTLEDLHRFLSDCAKEPIVETTLLRHRVLMNFYRYRVLCWTFEEVVEKEFK